MKTFKEFINVNEDKINSMKLKSDEKVDRVEIKNNRIKLQSLQDNGLKKMDIMRNKCYHDGKFFYKK